MTKDLYAVNRPIAFTFLDADGDEVGHRGAIIGKRLTLEQMPAYLPAAFIAMEDRSFYRHHGFDRARAGARDVDELPRAGMSWPGGSTITQQTVKIVFLNQERTFSAQDGRSCSMPRSWKSRCPRSRSSSSISTASIWAPAPMAWTARRMSISTSRRAI